MKGKQIRAGSCFFLHLALRARGIQGTHVRLDVLVRDATRSCGGAVPHRATVLPWTQSTYDFRDWHRIQICFSWVLLSESDLVRPQYGTCECLLEVW